MEAARLARQRRRMIMYKKRMAKMHSTNIVSSKKFGGGSHRSKKHKDIAMIHDTDSCKRARLNRRMVLNLNRTRESSSNARCLRRSTPSAINVFSHSVVGLNGDVATTTTVQEFGIHLPTNASALDKHLPTTELTGLGMQNRKPIDIDLSKRSNSTQRKFTELWNFGPPSRVCEYCNAILWYEERNRKSKNTKNPKFSICCREGRVKLPLLKSPPPELQELLQHSEHYKANIRRFNSMFAMTSMGGNVDVHANEGRGPYIFRLNGQNHHRIGSLLPVVGKAPSFAQLYIHDTKKEIHYRLNALPGQESEYDLDIAIVQILLKMLDENNVLVKTFRMARDRFKDSDMHNVRLRLIGSRSGDGREQNMPTCSEVAAIIVGDLSEENIHRDIIVEKRSGLLQRINELHPKFMAMQYPLLFPYGEDGFRNEILKKGLGGAAPLTEEYVTMQEYYAYQLQQRENEGETLILGRRLRQQFLVDAYTCVEEYRLIWVRNHQLQLRSEVYFGIKDAVFRGDTTPSSIGKRVVLPSTFTGSPRYMIQNYQDAMSICRWAGYPDLFITFTCNPKWPEIESFLSLIPAQRPEDRPDIIARVFKIKLDQLLRDLKHGKHFGKVIAVNYTVEWQKRGLPHAHILLYLYPDDKHPTPADIDKIISAEIPDKITNPGDYEVISQYMIHGPCGFANPKSPCMVDNKCRKHFPKKFYSDTVIDEDGYAIYRRRDNGMIVEKNGVMLDNRFVVPYNIDLLVKYQAHINVEWCNRSKSIKYLFKYVNKGSDRATFVLYENLHTGATSEAQHITNIDEIKTYLDCRYISASEACWRLFEFDIQYREPAVQRLSFHIENEQNVTFKDSDYLDNVLERPDITKTMFTEWIKANEMYDTARNLTYCDFPTKWVWHRKQREWRPRKSGRCIGRIFHAHPASGDRFYLRMLLNVAKGARSFEEIRTIDHVVYPTYRAACYAYGLLDDDKEWDDAIKEASNWASGRQLRELFATLLLFCEVTDPHALWMANWELLSDDILYRQKRLLMYDNLHLTEEQIQNHALFEIEQILVKSGRSLKEFDGIKYPNVSTIRENNNRLLQEELDFDRLELAAEHKKLLNELNVEQRKIYDAVIQDVACNSGGLYFVYGHGGTGKTYLWKTLIACLRSQGKIVLAVASSGIAALLLPGGRTAHSRFQIPIIVTEESTCGIKQGTHAAELMTKVSLIIWDEAPMAHRNCFEAVDRSLRDLLRFADINSANKTFGGKTVVLGGDFRQILPVIAKGHREDIVDASVNRSYLWNFCKVFVLTQNMRLQQPNADSNNFAEWILKLGNGELGEVDSQSNIVIPSDLLIDVGDDPIQSIVTATYPDLHSNYADGKYLEERSILAPTNDVVNEINDYIIDLLASNEETYLSADSICKASRYIQNEDVLYPVEFLNSLKFPGIPNHKLRLKVGLPVMLLRNINQSAGLCNGTRLVVTQLSKWVIEAKVITGSHVGNKVFIPRIVLSPSDTKWPFVLKRRQFPISVCFAMTINKSQGQSLKHVGLFLPKPVFSHGQLYVAVSRVTTRNGLKLLIIGDDGKTSSTTKNIVYKEVFRNIHINM